MASLDKTWQDLARMEEFDDVFDENDFVKGITGVPAIILFDTHQKHMIKTYLQTYEANLVKGDHFSDDSPPFFADKMTSTGLKKLKDLKISIGRKVQEAKKEKDRLSIIPAASEPLGFPLDNADEFIVTLQKWGALPIDDSKYYLHIVFRYYMKNYHDFLVQANQVINYPSYQDILDILYPCDCASVFPPDFRVFLVNAYARSPNTSATPVPVKGSGKNVCLDHNFEAVTDVAIRRRYIERVFDIWKQTSFCTYPIYLCSRRPGSEYMEKQFTNFLKLKRVKKEMKKLEDLPSGKVRLVDVLFMTHPSTVHVYNQYLTDSCQLKTDKLQLELMLRAKYRDTFVECKKLGIHSDLARIVVENDAYLAAAAGLASALKDFETYCSGSGRKIRYKQSSTRAFLDLTLGTLVLLDSYGMKPLTLIDETVYLYFTITEGIKQATVV